MGITAGGSPKVKYKILKRDCVISLHYMVEVYLLLVFAFSFHQLITVCLSTVFVFDPLTL